MTFHEAAIAACGELRRAGITSSTAALDADLLARHALGWDLATWLTHRAEPADASFEQRYAALVARRLTREPMAYIRGVQEFWGREFRVTQAVLIPRPETELTVEVAHSYLTDRANALVVDIGTGSGCLAITLALEHPSIRVYATDISADALAVARENAVRLGANDRVRFLQGTYLAAVPRPVDVIVSNPPYVIDSDRPALAPEVKDYEPAVALFGGSDGLRDVRAILHEARAALVVDGRLIMEIGDAQAERVEPEVAAIEGLELEAIHPDLQGIPRVMSVRRIQTTP